MKLTKAQSRELTRLTEEDGPLTANKQVARTTVQVWNKLAELGLAHQVEDSGLYVTFAAGPKPVVVEAETTEPQIPNSKFFQNLATNGYTDSNFRTDSKERAVAEAEAYRTPTTQAVYATIRGGQNPCYGVWTRPAPQRAVQPKLPKPTKDNLRSLLERFVKICDAVDFPTPELVAETKAILAG